MKGKRGRNPTGDPAEVEVIETDLQVTSSPAPIASVTRLPVPPLPEDRVASLLERLERLERGLEAVGARLDLVATPVIRLVEAHDDPASIRRLADRPKGGVQRPSPVHAKPTEAAAPDYAPEQVFLGLQKMVVDRLRYTEDPD